MYRVMIADDEPPIVDGIRELLRSQDHYTFDVYSAYNGQQALRLLFEVDVDLLIADINMPGLNGLELVKKVKYYWPACKIILLTGYSNFEYIYEANQYKEVYYVLKTINDNDFLAKVFALIEQVKNERAFYKDLNRKQEYLDAYRPLVRQDILTKLVNSDNYYLNISQADLDDLQVPLRLRAKVLPVLVSVAVSRCGGENLVLGRTLEEAFHGTYIFQLVSLEANLTVALIQTAIQKIEDNAYNPKKRVPDARMVYIISDAFVRWKNVPSVVKKLAYYSRINLNIEGPVVLREYFFHQRISWGSQHERLTIDTLQKLYFYFETNQKGKFYELWEPVLKTAGTDEGGSYVQNQQLLYGLKFLLLLMVNKLPDNKEKKEFEIKTFESDLSVIEQGEIEKIFYLTHAQNLECQSHPVKLVLEYIDTHLDKDVSIIALADFVKLSPGYLSRLFKKEKGRTLLQYISDKRVEVAKKYLINSNLRITEIASKVGFTSANYFIRFFKNNVGNTPQQYRETKPV